MSAGAPWWKVTAVWVARILTGAVFILSGWAKTVDPRGFVIKIEEYLNVWSLADAVPYDIVIMGAVALSIFELTVGIMLLTGSLRRSTPIFALLMMAFMLPLTAYIAIANPVADCGCFGDLWVVSNTFTFVKNLIITALLVILLMWRKAALPLYRPGLQWLTIVLTVIYGMVIAFIGWQFQPVADFRPYPVGTDLFAAPAEEESEPKYIYIKDGEERAFTMSELPDSTWTFVRPADGPAAADNAFAIFDDEGNDVAPEIFDPADVPGSLIIIAVAEPSVANLTRARLANEISGYASSRGIPTIGLVALSGDALARWRDIAMPAFDTYSASDTFLKELVRGPIGIIMLKDGKIVWKRNFATLNPDILSEPDPFGSVKVVDDGRVACWLSGFYLAGMLLLLGISALTKINIKPRRKKKAQSSQNVTDSPTAPKA